MNVRSIVAAGALLTAVALSLPVGARAATTLGHREPAGWLDLSGTRRDPFRNGGKAATVLIFIAHDCPLSNRYVPTIRRIYSDYARRNVAFFLVYSEPDISRAAAKRHDALYGITLPTLLDPERSLARAAGATVTPEVAVFGADKKRFYLGRIDNRAIDFTRERDAPSRRDLRLTLDAVLGHHPVPNSFEPAIGCYISTLKN